MDLPFSHSRHLDLHELKEALSNSFLTADISQFLLTFSLSSSIRFRSSEGLLIVMTSTLSSTLSFTLFGRMIRARSGYQTGCLCGALLFAIGEEKG